jgi:hypothetical protein
LRRFTYKTFWREGTKVSQQGSVLLFDRFHRDYEVNFIADGRQEGFNIEIATF